MKITCGCGRPLWDGQRSCDACQDARKSEKQAFAQRDWPERKVTETTRKIRRDRPRGYAP